MSFFTMPRIFAIISCALMGTKGVLTQVLDLLPPDLYSENIDPLLRFDFKIRISYQDAMHSIESFNADHSGYFRPLLYDQRNQQILVGARNAIFRISSANFKEVERLEWSPTRHDKELCQMKGQNLINDLSYSYGDPISGIGFSPYSPNFDLSYAMTEGDQLFTTVATDFSGSESGIFRIWPKSQLTRTPKFNDRWLKDPEFVGVFEVEKYIFIFFREEATEATGCGNTVFSRVARVCKNDLGGDVILQDHWVTFSKARLNCSFTDKSGHLQFFHHLQSVAYDEDNHKFYAAFTSNGIPGKHSAICVYNVKDVMGVFDGPFNSDLSLGGQGSSALSLPRGQRNAFPGFNCSIPRSMKTKLAFQAQKHQLLLNSVLPSVSKGLREAIHVAPLQHYQHAHLDKVRVKALGLLDVLFVFTRDGLMKKFLIHPDVRSACLVEVVQLTPKGVSDEVLGVKILEDEGKIIVGTQKTLLNLRTHRCGRFLSKQECVDAQDPYCGWNSKIKACGPAPGGIVSHYYWHQNIQGCPNLNFPVNGAWSEWSAWFACPQANNRGENCKCRNRACSNPPPRLGGSDCDGPSIQVTNCTVNGAWSAWTEWSACSASCGHSTKTRNRFCSDPSPSYGGRSCSGPSTDQAYCENVPCPTPTPPPTPASWSPWGYWEACSAKCGGGIQKRSRLCHPGDAPLQKEEARCNGCDTEYRVCNRRLCDEVRRWSEWSPWLMSPSTSVGNSLVSFERYKFACKARIANPSLISVAEPRVQKRLCSHDNTHNCLAEGQDETALEFQQHIGPKLSSNFESLVEVADEGANWSEWSDCSRPCNNGTQSRYRHCSGSQCKDRVTEIRYCNSHSCEVTWSCWTEYGPCSATCGTGLQHRSRKCLSGLCGENTQYETIACDAGPCPDSGGYAEWSNWSACGPLGVKVRIRPCIEASMCLNTPEAQMKKCDFNRDQSFLEPQADHSMASFNLSQDPESFVGLICGILGAFLGGIALTCLVTSCFIRHGLCCFSRSHGNRKKNQHAINNNHPPTPSLAKANIYTPPPVVRNIHPVPNLTLNPLLTGSGCKENSEFYSATLEKGSFGESGHKSFTELTKEQNLYSLDDLTEQLQETSLTLKRNMRAMSQHGKDFV